MQCLFHSLFRFFFLNRYGKKGEKYTNENGDEAYLFFCSYSVITPVDGQFGSLSAGRWTGLVGDILSGRADVIVAQLSHTYSRAQVIDYSSVLIKFRLD